MSRREGIAGSLKLRTSMERVAAHICRQPRLARNAASYILPIEKRLLASYLGMIPKDFPRAIKSLQSDGVAIDGMRIIITALKALEAIPDLIC